MSSHESPATDGIFLSVAGRRFLLILSTTLFVAGQVVSASQATGAPENKLPEVTAPEHPIAIDQLRTFMLRLNSVEQMKQLTMEEAERQRKTLPLWFPPTVWDSVERKIMAIDIPLVMLPTYQRYVSQEDADALLLFFQGPLGEQLGAHFVQREAESARSGTSGSATSARAIQQTSQGADADLASRRMSELSPEDQKRVVAARQRVFGSWKTVSDELSASYNNQVNSVIQKEVAAHNSELVAAKQSYLRKPSSQKPSQ